MADHYFKIFGERITRKVALALFISLVLHLAVIYGIKVQPARQGVARHSVIEARLGPVVPPQERVIALDPAPSQTEVPDDIKPEMAPAPSAPPRQVAEATPSVAKPSPVSGEQSRLPALDVPLPEDPTYYPAKQLDVQPSALYPITPQYPQVATVDNVEGEVTLLLLIDESGVVRDVSVVEARPEGYFEESAVSAFRNARFSPARKNGRDVKSRALIRVQYQMKDGLITPGTSLRQAK